MNTSAFRTTNPDAKTLRKRWGYYKREHALSVKAIADSMLDDNGDANGSGKSLFISSEAAGLSVSTLEKMLSQAACYLCDYMDTPDGKYAKWRNAHKFRKDFAGKRVLITATSAVPELVVGVVDTPEGEETTGKKKLKAKQQIEWTNVLDAFLVGEGSETEHLKIEGVDLTAEDKTFIRSSCIALGDIEVLSLTDDGFEIKRKGVA